MLSELCHYMNNYFDRDQPKLTGGVNIEDGLLNWSDLGKEPVAGQYYRITGSVLNDGVHKHPADDLVDETFDGMISLMAVPKAVVALNEEIDQWIALYGKPDSAAMSPYQSESFGGYSYSKGGARSDSGGSTATTWQDVFKNRLAQWVRIRSV